MGFRAASVFGGAVTSTPTIAKPSGTTAGDILVAHISCNTEVAVTAPSGWSLLLETSQRLYTFTKVASTSEPANYTFQAAATIYISGSISAYSDMTSVGESAESSGTGSQLSAPSVTASDGNILICAFSSGNPTAVTIVPSTALTERAAIIGNAALSSADKIVTTAGQTGVQLASMNGSQTWFAHSLILAQNVAPTAPTLLTPTDTETINRAIGNVFTWQFNDPDSDDTQSAYNLQYKLTTNSTWTTTGWVTSAVSSWTALAGTFAAGTYEWKVATRDQDGAEGQYSATRTFTAADPPPGPTITDPLNGGTIASDTYPVVWSTSSQDAYQLQVLDGTTVLFDTGTVTDTVTRSLVVSFPDNNTARTIQLRVQNAGLWSPWSTVTVTVSYTPPPAGVVSVTANPMHGSLIITPTFPAPVSPEPAVIGYDVWMRRVGTTGDGIRLAASIPPQQSWEWWLPASGVDYEFRVRGLGGNGTSSWSVWAPGVPVYNLVQNPRGRTTSGTVVVRENLANDPRATSLALPSNQFGWGAGGYGAGGDTGTAEIINNATDSPVPSITTYLRKTWATVASQNQLLNIGVLLTSTYIPGYQTAFYPVTPGEVWTLSFFTRRSWIEDGTASYTCRLNLAVFDATGAQVAATILTPTAPQETPAGQWVRIYGTVTIPQTGAYLRVFQTYNTSKVIPVGSTLDSTGLLAEKTAELHDYCDGSYSPDPDLTPAWTGTADASPSQLLGPAPVGWAGGYYSASTDAVKVPASGSSVSVPSGAATLVVFDPDTGQTTYTPTTGGTVTIPGPATVRAAIVPGTYAGPYFDGDSLGAYWLGDEHESVSILYPVDG